MENRLDRSFYLRDAVTVARELLGARLTHVADGVPLVAEITETEAYAGANDRACHSYGNRRTGRTEVLYGPGGHAYIYLIYGMYHLFNAVVGEPGDPCAVLVRGARVVEGHNAVALARTGKPWDALAPRARRDLLAGPGRFCSGLGLTKAQNTWNLTGDLLYLTPRPAGEPAFTIGVGKRVGIDYAGADADLPYRFFMETE